MTKTLTVYFHEKKIGQLVQDNNGEMNFTYSDTWLQNPHAKKISCSLPLQGEIFNKKQCQAFFGGILPEENQRKIIARNLGISANNDFSLLEKIGGECAGALSFIPEGQKLNLDNQYRKLTSTQFSTLLNEIPNRPLLAGDQDIRLSLAGVQDKLAVYIKKGKIYIPLNTAPSTHIIKPDFNFYEGVIFNEIFCLELAKKIEITTVDAELKTIENLNYLLIKRYDRIYDIQKIIRVHQEDFCQALGIPTQNKYQNEGGPSLKQCFDLIRRESTTPVTDLEKMIKLVIFNYLIGNCDAHGKNFSLLYLKNTQLAPAYDLICTLFYKELSSKMAMKLGGEYNIHKIKLEHFNFLATEIGFSAREVQKLITNMIDYILTSLNTIDKSSEVQEKIARIIQNRCENFK